ncbi:MAG: hypothetical protein Q9199_000574 [Rusavskia elegans]
MSKRVRSIVDPAKPQVTIPTHPLKTSRQPIQFPLGTFQRWRKRNFARLPSRYGPLPLLGISDALLKRQVGRSGEDLEIDTGGEGRALGYSAGLGDGYFTSFATAVDGLSVLVGAQALYDKDTNRGYELRLISGSGKDLAIGNVAIAVGFLGASEEILRLRFRSNISLLVLRWVSDLGQFDDLAVIPFDLNRTATETASILDSTDHLRATGRFLAVSTAAAVLYHEGLTEVDFGADGVLEIAYDETGAFFVGARWGLDDDGTPLIGLVDIE